MRAASIYIPPNDSLYTAQIRVKYSQRGLYTAQSPFIYYITSGESARLSHSTAARVRRAPRPLGGDTTRRGHPGDTWSGRGPDHGRRATGPPVSTPDHGVHEPIRATVLVVRAWFTGAMSHLQALDASITAPMSGVGGFRALDQRPREHGAGRRCRCSRRR